MRIIVREDAFSPDFIPPSLPHREEQLRQLEAYMRDFVADPGAFYPRAVLVGRQGSGKTVTLKTFGKSIGDRVKFAYVSCFINRTFTAIIGALAQQLGLTVPKRGLGRDELIDVFLRQIKDKDLYAVLALDDVFNLPPDIIAAFIRMGLEVEKLGRHRLGLVLVSHTPDFIDALDPSTRGILGKPIVRFPPYTSDQIFSILEQRAKIALAPSSYDEEVLEMIADITGAEEGQNNRGDARLALEILYRAAAAAEMDGVSSITPEHVRRASKEVLSGISADVIKGLPLHAKLLLLAIVRALKSGRPYVTFGEAEEMYRVICEEYGERPRAHAQLWAYLNELKNKGIIETRPNRRGEGLRGRTTLISIAAEPLDTLEKLVKSIAAEELR
ncbi:MAG: ORC1-type DNA replication protein [Thermoproteus sp. AZ2]|jgi:cell division control protein 6|uniref:ORC1-type DNA replication protein n=1 Tax=Thermoproteus sp. AZ2 TaxID=1609232 RepID=A0ACC6V1B8_9CREN|nr:MAG: cell division control protein Cdc6 [Thermoproteus sp. AZ2]